ncbi:BPL-N domain-containing protein [Amycolatopsis alba]|uniref:BPL-N domain-containing protein n=1 Tax=Amycolatopsis alba TaxID=76020 RepID=UPI001FD871F3|nr:BPL-N domain-containing protein [Amycolatopsis alba]
MSGTDPKIIPSPSGLSRRRVLLGALPVAALLAVGCGRQALGDEVGRKRLALVYNGPQGCTECAPTVAALLRKAPQPFDVKYVGPGTGIPLTAATLAEAQLYVQPGGGADLERTWRDLRGSAQVVRDWVQAGGSYLGLCFGGYLAGSDPGFGLLPGDSYGYAGSPGSTVPDDRDTVLEVTWRGESRHMYFQDGPAFRLNGGADATVLATYDNGAAAVVVAPYGKGRVGVSGPHPEADESWYEDAGLTNPDGVRFDLAHELIDTTIGRP